MRIPLLLLAVSPLLLAMTSPAAPLPEKMTAAQAHSLMTAPHSAVTVVDVRTPEEYAASHIPGALNVPVDQVLDGALPATMADKNRTYLLYCRSGHRAGLALEALKAKGYRRVSNFGGIGDWTYGTAAVPRP